MTPITGLDTAEGREADDWPPEGFFRIRSPRFRPRELKIPAAIFEYGWGGYNNHCVLSCPMSLCKAEKWGTQYRRQWLWQPFCIPFRYVRRFLSHCEYLGTEIPAHLLGVGMETKGKQLELFA